MIDSARTSYLQNHVDSLDTGDMEARDALITDACDRLRLLTRRMSHGDRVKRFADTDDVLHGALIALRESLRRARPATVADFMRLAAFHIRRELVRLSREYYGPAGWATRHALMDPHQHDVAVESPHASPFDRATAETMRREDTTELYAAIDELGDELRDVVDLLWLHGLSQEQTARILKVSTRTVRRRWLRARLQLSARLSPNGDV